MESLDFNLNIKTLRFIRVLSNKRESEYLALLEKELKSTN